MNKAQLHIIVVLWFIVANTGQNPMASAIAGMAGVIFLLSSIFARD